MEWFKHDSNANIDEKLQEVLLDYGLEGYGLYWYCLELIVGKLSENNITFELKHDARVIARNTGSTTQKVEEMMRRFVELGLFENGNGAITCMKVARRLASSATSNPAMRRMISVINKSVSSTSDQVVMTESCRSHDVVMKEENRKEENRKEENNLAQTQDAGVNSFDVFYSKYPVKKSKAKAQEVWKKLKPDDALISLMIIAIDNQIREKEQLRVAGRFVPEWKHPSTWLNGRCWEDEISSEPVPAVNRAVIIERQNAEVAKNWIPDELKEKISTGEIYEHE